MKLKKVKTVQLTARFEKFDGDVEKWRKSFFELLSLKNTFGLFYELTIESTRDGKAYVVVVPHNPDTAESVIDTMESYGYRDIEKCDVNVGEVQTDDWTIDYVSFE